MKKFTSNLIIITILTYGFLFFLEHVQDKFNSSVKDTDSHVLNSIKNGIEADLIFLGSSRTSTTYSSVIFNSILNIKSFNLGYTAGNEYSQSLYLNFYMKYNNPPKIVIQNIDLAHFSNSKIVPNYFYTLPFYNDFKTDSTYRNLYFNRYIDVIPYIKYNGWNRNNFFHLKKKIVNNNNSTYDFYKPYDKKFELDNHNLKRIKENNSELDLDYIEKAISTQISFFEQYNTQIYYVWLPEREERYTLYGEKCEVIKRIIEDKFSDCSKCFFIDLSEYSEAVTSEDFFYDTFHLNKAGSELLSKYIANLLKD